MKYSYGDRSSAYSVRRVRPSGRFFDSTAAALQLWDPLRGHCEAGSLTGAVHLSNDNAGVLRPAQRGRKPRVEQKGKCWLDLSLQYGARSRNVGLSILFILEFKERGVRKITTGIGDRARGPPRGVAWILELSEDCSCQQCVQLLARSGEMKPRTGLQQVSHGLAKVTAGLPAAKPPPAWEYQLSSVASGGLLL